MPKVLLNEQEVSHPHYLLLAEHEFLALRKERTMDLDAQSLPLSAFAEAPLAQLI